MAEPESPTPATIIVITETNILINFICIDAMHILGRLPGYHFILPTEVLNELIAEEERASIEDALTAGHIALWSLTSVEALAQFVELRDIMGRGEAACLAGAVAEGWHLASDEKKRFRRCAIELIGENRILRTEDLLLKAIQAGQISLNTADTYKAKLAENRYVMPFLSFKERLEIKS